MEGLTKRYIKQLSKAVLQNPQYTLSGEQLLEYFIVSEDPAVAITVVQSLR